jgi:hypothetical protein
LNIVCKKCGEQKPIGAFNKKLRAGPLVDWNVDHCKACAHAEYMRRYETPEARAAMQETARGWKKANPKRHAELARAYRRRHPEKIIAQNRLNHAVRKGIVKRAPCEVCGTTDRVHAHHRSYAPEDWFNVRWLCFVCHKLEHTEPPSPPNQGEVSA